MTMADPELKSLCVCAPVDASNAAADQDSSRKRRSAMPFRHSERIPQIP